MPRALTAALPSTTSSATPATPTNRATTTTTKSSNSTPSGSTKRIAKLFSLNSSMRLRRDLSPSLLSQRPSSSLTFSCFGPARLRGAGEADPGSCDDCDTPSCTISAIHPSLAIHSRIALLAKKLDHRVRPNPHESADAASVPNEGRRALVQLVELEATREVLRAVALEDPVGASIVQLRSILDS